MSTDGAQAGGAVVVGVQLPGVSDGELDSSLEEIERLATTLGLRPVARVTQRRAHLEAAAVLGEGKLKELAQWTGGTGVVPSGVPAHRRKKASDADETPPEVSEVEAAPEESTDAPSEGAEPSTAPRARFVVVDHDLTPTQARNLERATGAEVLDRTGVILAIFHRHARTREAKLQVEIARLRYEAPRLRETGGGGDRQRGGIGGKGAGESALELDRRKIRDRIAELRLELASIDAGAGERRSRRSEHPTVALVGYTNAGKSSLMRALTGSEVYVADKLFATLDTTVRALHPESKPRILVSDTVGFIKKLPHDLVASFRSTLAEAADASLLLHVVDAADAAFESQIEVTRSVLAELGSVEAPRRLVFNKCDRLAPDVLETLRARFPDALFVSAKRPADVAALRAEIIAFFERDMTEEDLVVPMARSRVVAEAHASARVVSERWDEAGAVLRVRAPAHVLERLRRAAEPPPP